MWVGYGVEGKFQSTGKGIVPIGFGAVDLVEDDADGTLLIGEDGGGFSEQQGATTFPLVFVQIAEVLIDAGEECLWEWFDFHWFC